MILIISEEQKTQAVIKEALSAYQLAIAATLEQASSCLQRGEAELIIIDYDGVTLDGLQIFHKIHPLAPQVKVIMLSAANNIALAVRATKLGVADFLKKPLDVEQLRKSVKLLLAAAPELVFQPAEAWWLQGTAAALQQMYTAVKLAREKGNNLLLIGGSGINKKDVVSYLHAGSKRRLVTLDLNAFRGENSENYFWAGIQEIMSEPGLTSAQSEEDRCGTIFLDNVDSLDDNFQLNIYAFVRERKGRADQKIMAIIGLSDAAKIKRDLPRVIIPSLLERKEDLPLLLAHCLWQSALKHNKIVKGVSAEALALLLDYDFPGNYVELERLIEQAVLKSVGDIIDVRDLPLHYRWLEDYSIGRVHRRGKLSLEEAKKEFEKNLLTVVLAKADQDQSLAARFVDLPRTVFADRSDQLGNSLLD